MFSIRDDGLLRGGIFRRMIAFTIDMTLVAFLLQLAGVAGFWLTDGHIRASSGFGSTLCQSRAAPPLGLAIPQSFRVDFVTECAASLFGAPYSRSAKIGRRTRIDAVMREEAVTIPLDASGRAGAILDLSLFILPLFAAMRIFFERDGGRTLGRRLTGLRLIAKDVAILDRRRLVIRYAAMFAPLAPGVAFDAWIATLPPFGLMGAARSLAVFRGLCDGRGARRARLSLGRDRHGARSRRLLRPSHRRRRRARLTGFSPLCAYAQTRSRRSLRNSIVRRA
ncbi:RDD family protein [Methylosinus sp. RM1]|uniref:RDD family protein n=1 Tax=Methylosinus sp. RM1 TaxID=2583817 RepID=UPI00140E2A3D|nr:RDD family protein [Methylosinus sp. RM1]